MLNGIEVDQHAAVAAAGAGAASALIDRRGSVSAWPVIAAHARVFRIHVGKARAQPVKIGVIRDVDVEGIAYVAAQNLPKRAAAWRPGMTYGNCFEPAAAASELRASQLPVPSTAIAP